MEDQSSRIEGRGLEDKRNWTSDAEDMGPKDQRTKKENIAWANRTYEKSHMRLKKV